MAEDKKIPVLKRLLETISKHKDFPAMTRTISLVSKQTASTSEASITDLTNTILDDIALSNKLLKMVNAPYYIKYHGTSKINTISRAVQIMGFHQVRDAALSLMSFEKIKDKSIDMDVRESYMTSFMCSIIAKEMGKRLGVQEVEEAFICSMFHDLGKLLVRYYLPEEQKKIKEYAAAQKVSEEDMAINVLKMSYDTIGMEIAKHWKFSDNIVSCMRKTPLYRLNKPNTDLEMIRTLSIFSSKLCELMDNTQLNMDDWQKALTAFKRHFDDCFKSDEAMIQDVLKIAYEELMVYCENYNFKSDQSHFLNHLSYFMTGKDKSKKADKSTEMLELTMDMMEPEPTSFVSKGPIQIIDNKKERGEDSEEPITPEAILTKGIVEVSDTLAESTSLNDVLRMILEVLYRGMSFNRIIITIKESKEPFMSGRFGFGADIGRLVKGFRFPINRSLNDVFNLTLNNDSIVIINNVNDVEVLTRMPPWLRSVYNPKAFMMIPVSMQKVPIALIYGDWINIDPKAFDPKRLKYVKTLKNQAMMALRQFMR
ncbi:MAG: HDOD domain-containing protein [Nitrospirae bacterium]|nr:HDOD domain-containing protein [Nitrospirota bacterium]